jgi:autotransporter translocation and assembly factor TamB
MTQPHLTPDDTDSGSDSLGRRITINTIRAIIDRAVVDSEFLVRLARDPIGTAYAEGYAVSAEEIKALLGLSQAPDRNVMVALQARLADWQARQSRAPMDGATGS